MPRLLRFRIVSVGHPQARLDDLTLDFRDAEGNPTDSTIWLRNGGGKSSLLNLFFAILRPHKGEFLGGKADAKQRTLEDYVLPGDRAVTAVEWELDAATDSLELDSDRFLTGVFYERREGATEVRRLFFATRVSDSIPESTLAGLPLFLDQDGHRKRRTFAAFREAWAGLRDRAPHLNAALTENQGEWQELLEAARIDPELFSYQVRMNRREGGADELFRFADADAFIDFLLALALDPALGDRVGRNISAFKRELLLRKEQQVPEQQLVAGLLQRMEPLQSVRSRRFALRGELGTAASDLEALDRLAASRIDALGLSAEASLQEARQHDDAFVGHSAAAARLRGEAAALRRHACRLRLDKLENERLLVQAEWREAQRMARCWAAAVPLGKALDHERKAREYRRLLEERRHEQAPLLAELTAAASRLAAVLDWSSSRTRDLASTAIAGEKAARDEARECRRQAGEAAKVQGAMESQARSLESRLDQASRVRERLASRGDLRIDENPEAALERRLAAARDREEAIKGTRTAIDRCDELGTTLRTALSGANDDLTVRQGNRRSLEERLEEARRARAAIEANAPLQRALELESLDADRLGDDALATLDRRARAEQKAVVDARIVEVEDERAVIHIEEQGLLPPSPDCQRVADFLRARLGHAWSGWTWIAENVRRNEAGETVRQAPYFAQGVVVRPGEVHRACELLREAGIVPEGPLFVAATDAIGQPPPLPGEVVGPAETGWFDRGAAKERLASLRKRLEEQRDRIRIAEIAHRELVQAREALRAFRERYPAGWFRHHEGALQEARERAEEAGRQVTEITGLIAAQAAERRRLDNVLAQQRDELQNEQEATHRLEAFLADHWIPAREWRDQLAQVKRGAETAKDDVRRWEEIAHEADSRAESAAAESRGHGENARVLEQERLGLRYVTGSVSPAPGDLEAFRDQYGLLSARYEERIGADGLMALATEKEREAQQEREALKPLLMGEITEELATALLETIKGGDTPEGMRLTAYESEASLRGKMGNLTGQQQGAQDALERAQSACVELSAPDSVERQPSSPELADAEANRREQEATAAKGQADQEGMARDEKHARANEAHGQADRLVQRRETIERMRQDYSDLLSAGLGDASREPVAAIEEAALAELMNQLSKSLRKARATWQSLDDQRGAAAQAVRTWIADPAFDRLDTPWTQRFQEHDEAGMEEASERLSEQLALRLKVLQDQIASVERHRTVLVDELHALAEEGLRLLRQASNLSRLPDHLPGLGGAHFLRITTQEPEDPGERRARLAELIDEVISGERDLGGIALVQTAVRRVARPIQVRVLHPDPALERRAVGIPEMARASGGEQLTGAILLYCTLARVRGRMRGNSRRASSVLILDNPIGRASRTRFLELQRDVARAMGVQLIYTTGVNDHEALRTLPNVIRLRNERVDRTTRRRLVEHVPDDAGLIEAVRIGRREGPATVESAE